MKLIKILFMILIMAKIFAVDIQVELNKKEVVLGEQFQLTIRFEYDGAAEPFVSFEPVNAEIIGDNTNSNTRVESRVFFSGGKAVQKKIYNLVYQLQPVKIGHAHIRDIKIDLGGNVLKERTQSLRVIAEARELADFIFRAEVSSEEVYKGQAINLDYYLYFENQITARPIINKHPVYTKFLKRFEIPETVQVETVNLQGQVYKRVAVARAKLFAEDSGELSIDPMEIGFQYPEQVRGQRDVFGMSMMFSGGRLKTKTLRSNRVTINVLPLPSENVPKNFSGLVGDHDFTFNITKEKILVNDVFEARLEITGDGALEKMDPPMLISNDGLEEFDAKTEIVELGNLNSKKIIDYTFLGKRATEVAGGQFGISIFDPEKRQYVEKMITIPSLSVYGTGASAQVLDTKKTQPVADKEKSSGSQNMQESNDLVAPITIAERGNWFNLQWLVLIVFIIGVLSILTPLLSLGDFFRSHYEIPKKLSYETIHNFLINYSKDTGGLRDIVKRRGLSRKGEDYFLQLIDDAEKNEYKNSTIKLRLDKKYFAEFAKGKLDENSKIN